MGAVDPDWQAWARCISLPASIFFDEAHEGRAKAACATCRVQQDCLDFALANREPDGVWGGMNERERLALSRTATAGGTPLVTVTYTTRARSTGATCSAGRTATGWGAACETHDQLASAPSRTAAEHAVSRPQEWCPGCAAIAGGDAPKVDRPA